MIKSADIAKMIIDGQDRNTIKARIIASMNVTEVTSEGLISQAVADWNLSEPKADAILSEAFDKIKSNVSEDKKNEALLAYSRFTELYRLNMEKGDFKECRENQKEINKLLGLNAPDKVDHTSDGKEIKTFTVEVVNKPRAK